MNSEKKLVIYYSLEGNTEFIAEAIASAVGADLLRLKPKKDINPKSFMRFFQGGKQVMTKEMPDLEPIEKKPEEYDLIFIGTPVWAGSYAPALRTFFSEHKLEGKKIALFCCCGGGAGNTLGNMKEQLQGNEIAGEISFNTPISGQEEKASRARQWAENCLATRIN